MNANFELAIIIRVIQSKKKQQKLLLKNYTQISFKSLKYTQ